MKKVIIIFSIVLLTLTLFQNSPERLRENEYKNISAEIYSTDNSMLRLIAVDYDFGYTNKQKAAEKMIKLLIIGNGENDKILRVIPEIKNGMGVKVKKNTAVVNLKKAFMEEIPENRDKQLLMLYSIVNSLTSIDGIDNVKFLIDGKEKKEYIGGIDMREVLIPDYYI